MIQLCVFQRNQHSGLLDGRSRSPGMSLERASKKTAASGIIQGHIGSAWKDGQYYRTREMEYVRPAFEDLLARLQTDYIDLGMIHYVDSEEEWEQIQHSDYLAYVMELKEKGIIHHIGMSSHNPKVALKAAYSGYVEMILFSVNPAFRHASLCGKHH